MPVLVGKKAPNFNAQAVVNGQIVESYSLDQFLGKKYVVLFFYPKDFTFVCPTEIIAFQDQLAEFEARDTQVIGCSTDTEFSHWAWVNLARDKGGIEGVKYPLVADTNKTIASAYDVLTGDYDIDMEGNLVASGELVAYRGLFLIDKEGVVRHQVVNDLPLGRSIKEALRMVDALQHVEQHGEVCPINWEKGAEAMDPSHEGVASFLSK
ncbi:peroxiredoxin [Cerasicoccus arenae]|uniref:Peroxidase n=1 Tax=Cerasicoccus arenae TaxID=424488 RepID=A0A8J3D8Q2_9BACT|nr:peroxiredoxin [Cerasicoccus arenae]MBK1858859.1 peroxiredoxin [Cerasicoccus arenae]GHB96096.1 peroxidase [Cerasicoccus arenae]